MSSSTSRVLWTIDFELFQIEKLPYHYSQPKSHRRASGELPEPDTRGDLPVFCVSNLEYWEHRTRPKGEALPFIRLSGILQVRKYCLSIVAESQLCAAIEYMTDAIPALLGSVELWVQSGSGSLSAERKQAMRNTLEEIQRALDTVSSFGRRLRILGLA